MGIVKKGVNEIRAVQNYPAPDSYLLKRMLSFLPTLLRTFQPTYWQDIAIGAGGLGIDSRAGQIGHASSTAGHRCNVS